MTQPHPEKGEPDDLRAAIEQGRPLRTDRGYRVLIGDEKLDFQPLVLHDPKPLARQLAEAKGARIAEDYVVAAILTNGDIETLRPDEPYDLRARGAEKFLVVRSDRTFRFMIDNADLEWPLPVISGLVVKSLAKLPDGYDLYQEVRGGKGHDIKIDDCILINLDDPGLERFISIEAETTEGLASLPEADEAYLTQQGIEFDVVGDRAGAGVILKGFPLADGVFDQSHVDLLIMLPLGYPDACPDMFYVLPWVRSLKTGQYPHAADVSHQFANQTWQRWSRHSQIWRPGVDGIHTMVARARSAFEKCAK
ncbi:multiubiquitin domain-containing protein [Hyphomonas sp.]|uniref:multiubiquitin domain-containing protein n=1 Tax=Hyphomonas sp. TaxID=87 RepID=UPI0025C58AEB|nr:multiubiquitin domain-containing protein [Hyphomonas sp.]